MKKLNLFIITFLALSVFTTACTEQSDEPTATVEAAVVPLEPEESDQAQSVAPELDNWCRDTDVVFFPGGPDGDPFASVVHSGAEAAATDLGANIEFVWSDWDPELMVTQFAEAVAGQPDGIAIMGHPGDEALRDLVDDAEAQGIIVTSQNTTLPELEAKYVVNGFGYVGAENYSAGHNLGAEAVNRFDFGAGDQAMVWGLLSQGERGRRTQGVIDALEEAGMFVDYLEIDAATNAAAAAGTATFVDYVSSNPDVDLIVTDHGALTSIHQTYLEAADLGPDDIYMVGFDLTPATVGGIRGGWTDLVIDQQQLLQGYLPILQICMTKRFAITGLHIDTGAGFAHADNIELLADLVDWQFR
ncbi:MAG: substrate-binding domain-containing protein [Anaerolineae bacterium]|nr:substrate-binding domain-containing protein [Anaerolineae bacterium]